MTDKQIIIDGHDVSKGNQKYMKESSPVENWYKAKINTVDGINLAECVHFTRQVDFGYCELSNDSCNEFQYNCVKNKNCYYKQLKRAEQRIVELNKTIQAKEQECEELKKVNEEKNELLAKLGCPTIATARMKAFTLQQQLDQLKAENEELKKIIERLDVPKHEVIDMDIALENEKLKQTLAEIKPILEFYANSKMGEEQPDRTYKIMLSGGCIMTYDPKPARHALQKIRECEVER